MHGLQGGICQGHVWTCPGDWISRYDTKWPILCWCSMATWSRPPSLTDFTDKYHPDGLDAIYYFYFYYLRWRMPPFMRQCWGLQVGPMHETAGMGKLINAALLSLMRRVWVYAVLPSSWVNSSAPLECRHDRVTREVRVHAYVWAYSGKGSGEEGILSGVVPVYLYCPAFNVSVSLGV